MATISDVLGATFQPVVVAVITVAVLALLRLITPRVRWSRRLKHDGEVLSALPDGKEKELWASSVTAQAERLRIYRENTRFADQAVAWYAFIVLLLTPFAVALEATHGWPNVRSFWANWGFGVIPGLLLVVMNLVFALLVTLRLILGGNTNMTSDGGGHYPKFEAVRRAERRRADRRTHVVTRAAEIREAERARTKELQRIQKLERNQATRAPKN